MSNAIEKIANPARKELDALMQKQHLCCLPLPESYKFKVLVDGAPVSVEVKLPEGLGYEPLRNTFFSEMFWDLDSLYGATELVSESSDTVKVTEYAANSDIVGEMSRSEFDSEIEELKENCACIRVACEILDSFDLDYTYARCNHQWIGDLIDELECRIRDFVSVMPPSKADFRALRERVGASHADLANALGVRDDTVKKWEKPSGPFPPDDAWAQLELWNDEIDSAVKDAVFQMGASLDRRIKNPFPFVFVYFRSQEEYETFIGNSPSDDCMRYYWQVNRASQRAAERFAMGNPSLHVLFRYPQDLPDEEWVFVHLCKVDVPEPKPEPLRLTKDDPMYDELTSLVKRAVPYLDRFIQEKYEGESGEAAATGEAVTDAGDQVMSDAGSEDRPHDEVGDDGVVSVVFGDGASNSEDGCRSMTPGDADGVNDSEAETEVDGGYARGREA